MRPYKNADGNTVTIINLAQCAIKLFSVTVQNYRSLVLHSPCAGEKFATFPRSLLDLKRYLSSSTSFFHM